MHDLASNGIDGGNSSFVALAVMDSLFINNTVMKNVKTPVYFKYSGCNFIQVTNSTFYQVKSYGFRIAGPGYTGLPDNTPTVIVDRTTWHDVGANDGREILLLEKGPNLNPWK